MNAAEKQGLLDQLHAGEERVLRLLEGLTGEQWNFREESGRWSIAECMEHIAAVEQRVLGRVREKLKEPAETERKHLAAGKDEMVAAIIPNRTAKRPAPEPVRPTGRWHTEQLTPHFRAARRATIEFAGDADETLRDHLFPHAALGEIDCYQWLLLLVNHAERHARQIEEIRNHPEFPAKSAITSARF